MLLAALTMLGLSSCQKDGVFNPKKKISKFYYEDASTGERQLIESFTWDNDVLTAISTQTDNFVLAYDGDQLKTARSADQLIEWTYEGNKVAKISEIAITFYIYDEKSATSNLSGLDFLFPDPMIKSMLKKQILQSMAANQSKDQSFTYTLKLEWNGDNLAKIYGGSTIEIGDSYYSFNANSTYTYDNKSNPFYGLLINSYVTSKNNITQLVEASTGVPETYSYSYSYVDNFPVEMVGSVNGVSVTAYYEYEK